MQFKKPSPALVVSFIALLVAMSGTAIAAKVLITSSSQIKNGTIRGADLKKGTITKKQLHSTVLSGVSGSSAAPATGAALETRRQYGPEVNKPEGGEERIAELQLPAGAYAIIAKTTIAPVVNDNGLLNEVLKDNKTTGVGCNLDVGGAGDFGIAQLTGPSTAYPATVNAQLTRTLSAPAVATLTCKAENVPWRAENTSIIAVPVSSVSLKSQ